jgi:hypothetical protein
MRRHWPLFVLGLALTLFSACSKKEPPQPAAQTAVEKHSAREVVEPQPVAGRTSPVPANDPSEPQGFSSAPVSASNDSSVPGDRTAGGNSDTEQGFSRPTLDFTPPTVSVPPLFRSLGRAVGKGVSDAMREAPSSETNQP